MAKLLMQNAFDVLDLDSIAATGTGYQALSGLTGMGMAPRTLQWVEGAGDGARYRSKRVNKRSLDIKLDVLASDREGLKALLFRLELMLAEPFTLMFQEDDGTQWTIPAVYSGGFDFIYGVDTIGQRDLQTVITVECGDPYWTSVDVTSRSIEQADGDTDMLDDLAAMDVSDSSAIGSIVLENTGTAPAYPIWRVYGPGENFIAQRPDGATIEWDGTIDAGDWVEFDTQRATVTDNTGTNRYADLAAAPRFWSVPPGVTTAVASLDDIDTGSKIVCTWRARKWLVI